MNATSATLLLLGAWLLLGGGTALVLARRGQPAATALSALIAWPVLLPLLGEPAGQQAGTRNVGPFATRIDTCFAALRSALTDPSISGIVTVEELVSLEQSMRRADGRIGMVDRLLSEDALRADPLAIQLARARELAADEIESVLRGVVQLRVQVGLVALAGDTLPVREGLRELGARVRAIEETSLA
ncbi:MAG: hypothetical protein Q8P18_29160 [Pseudomonadota bacterium]|nr:hypothetical protein [Pseudomonadota bacterium]